MSKTEGLIDKNEGSKNRTRLKQGIAIAIILILIPLTIVLGLHVLDGRKFFFVSLLIVIYVLGLFFLVFEFNKPVTRELVTITMLISLAVAGRLAFIFAPNVKPMSAIVIISGASLGKIPGFIVGAMSGFVSNFVFGQGPWTPWQMFAFGMLGFLAGFLFYDRKVDFSKKKSIVFLCIFGGLAVFFIYGGIVDIWTILGFTSDPSWKFALMVYTAALSINVAHAGSTVIFLAILGRPMIAKLDRIKKRF